MSTKNNELSLTLKRVRRGLRTDVNTGLMSPPAPPITFDKCGQTVVTKGGSIGGFKIYKGSGG